MDYNKPALDLNNQLAMLQARGLSIANLDEAKIFLDNVSYFRFAAYLRVFEQDSVAHQYRNGATFEMAAELYLFDAELRKLLFGAIQKIEIALRSRIIHEFSLAHGAFWFIDESLAVDKHKFTENLSTFERELQRTKEEFIKDHYTKYSLLGFPPAWKMLELISFGCLTKLYFDFADTPAKKRIARSFGVKQQEALESWMKAVNALRNACAHHSRVWNRRMAVKPQLLQKPVGKWINNKEAVPYRQYAIISCIAYWLNSIDTRNTFVMDLKVLFSKYPSVNPSAMGFPEAWNQQPLWK